MSVEEAAAGGAPVGKERGSLGKCWDWMRKQDKMTLMRLFGGCGGCVTIAFGLMSIFTLSILDPPQFVNDVYHVIFGALIILAELRWTRFLKHFKFLTTFLGLGMFYVFVGGINLNSDVRDIVLAIIFMIIGILYVCVGIFRKSVNEQMPGEAFNPDVEVNGVNVKQAVRVAAVMHQIQQVGKDRNQGVDTNDTQLNDAQQRV